MRQTVRVIEEPAASQASDALAQPTRARIFRTLAGLRRPATTAELAAMVSLHPNGVRNHLERLAKAGLVERSSRRGARGRPADCWQVAANGWGEGDPPAAYRELASFLAGSLPANPANLAAVERGGERIGRELVAGADGGEPLQPLLAALAALGFAPALERATGSRVSIRLARCPYREAAKLNGKLVCTLHLGLTKGLVGALAPDCVVSSFEPADPSAGRCRIELEGHLSKLA